MIRSLQLKSNTTSETESHDTIFPLHAQDSCTHPAVVGASMSPLVLLKHQTPSIIIQKERCPSYAPVTKLKTNITELQWDHLRLTATEINGIKSTNAITFLTNDQCDNTICKFPFYNSTLLSDVILRDPPYWFQTRPYGSLICYQSDHTPHRCNSYITWPTNASPGHFSHTHTCHTTCQILVLSQDETITQYLCPRGRH